MVSMYKTQKMCRDDCLVVCFKNSSYVKGTTHTHPLAHVQLVLRRKAERARTTLCDGVFRREIICRHLQRGRWRSLELVDLLICFARSYTGPWNDRKTGQSPVEQLLAWTKKGTLEKNLRTREER